MTIAPVPVAPAPAPTAPSGGASEPHATDRADHFRALVDQHLGAHRSSEPGNHPATQGVHPQAQHPTTEHDRPGRRDKPGHDSHGTRAKAKAGARTAGPPGSQAGSQAGPPTGPVDPAPGAPVVVPSTAAQPAATAASAGVPAVNASAAAIAAVPGAPAPSAPAPSAPAPSAPAPSAGSVQQSAGPAGETPPVASGAPGTAPVVPAGAAVPAALRTQQPPASAGHPDAPHVPAAHAAQPGSATGTAPRSDRDERTAQGAAAAQAPVPTPAAPTAPAAGQPVPGQPATHVGAAGGAAATGTPAPPAGQVSNAVLDQVLPVVPRLVSRGDGTQRLTLRLHPADLGEVRLTVTVKNGAVDVTLAAGHAARAALRDGSDQLRSLLELTGHSAGQLVIRDLPSSGGPAAAGVQPGLPGGTADQQPGSDQPGSGQPGAGFGQPGDQPGRHDHGGHAGFGGRPTTDPGGATTGVPSRLGRTTTRAAGLDVRI